MINKLASTIAIAGIGISSILASTSGFAITAASDYLRVTDEDGKIQKTPWVTNTPLGASNATAERAVIAIHSSGRDAIWYYEGIRDAAELAGELDNTMLYSLQFLTSSDLDYNNINSDFELNYWYQGDWKFGYKSRPNCVETTASLDDHESAGRAVKEYVGGYCFLGNCYGGTDTYIAAGSGDELGTNGSTTITVAERPYNWVESGSCPTDIRTDKGYSSFKFVDIVMQEFLDEGRFPNLKHVVVAGHSAGGMFVNRYGAGNLIDEMLQARGIEVTYIVAAPSTYMYLDANRPDTAVTAVTEGNGGTNGINDFGVTDTFVDASNANCSGYNNYFYGLQGLNGYMGTAGANQILSQYGQRKAVYMVGEYDNNIKAKDGLMKNCEADLEGSHRKERSKNYMNYMKEFYGEEISELHEQVVIPGVGHNGPAQFKSELGRTYMFPNLDDGIEHKPTINVDGVDIGETETTIYGTANDKDNNLEAVVLYFQGGGITCESTTSWSCTFTTPQSGDYIAQVKAVDDLGNESDLEDVTFTVPEAPACEDVTDTIANHEAASRAYSNTITEGETCYGTFCWGGTEVTTWYAQGSGENLGTNGNATVTLKSIEGGFEAGECPAGPSAPVIESHTVYLSSANADVRVTVTDIDEDIASVSLNNGVECLINPSHTEIYLCQIEGLEAGHHELVAIAEDATGLTSEPYPVAFDIAIGGSAPVIDNYTFEVIDGAVHVNGTASDADGNIRNISIDFGPGWGTCEGTTTFSCYYPATMFSPGETHTFHLKITDTANNHNTYNNIATHTFEDLQSCFTATNQEHIDGGRANLQYNVLVYANGSSDYLGMTGDTTSVEETSAGEWSKINNCN